MKNHHRAKGRTKKARLESKGWKFGSAATFLGLSPKESDRLDIEVARKRLADPKEVPTRTRGFGRNSASTDQL